MKFSFSLPPLSMNRLVKTELRSVEPMQVEASFQYRLMVKRPGRQLIYPDRYKIESYFIFPPQMRLSPATYPIDSFYRDLTSFINFRIPKLNYKEIVGSAENLDRSPLRKIRSELASETSLADKQRFVQQEARIFACAFYNFIQRKLRRLQKQMDKIKRQRIGDVEQLETAQIKLGASFEESFLKIHDIFREWQKVRQAPSAQGLEIQMILKSIDEYIAHNIHDFILQVDRSLNEVRLPESTAAQWKHRLRPALRGLRIYMRSQAYAWIDDSSSELDLERYFYHRGTLKRQVWSALYLDTRTKPLFKIQRQVGAMIAAGVAGAWGVLANITIPLNAGFKWGSQESLGFSSFLIVSALTLAYILKDRIKELGRGYFQGGLFGRLPDSSSKIIYQANSRRKSLHIGYHEEKVSYLDPQSLPADLNQILQAMAHERWDQEPHAVICYRKQIDLRSKKIRHLKHKIRAIYTFFRLNVANFLSTLDTPFEEMLIPTRSLETTSRLLPKVYHIDLVMKLSARMEEGEKSIFQYWRLVIDKNGVKRIEEVALPYRELAGPETLIEKAPLPSMEGFEAINRAQARTQSRAFKLGGSAT